MYLKDAVSVLYSLTIDQHDVPGTTFKSKVRAYEVGDEVIERANSYVYLGHRLKLGQSNY